MYFEGLPVLLFSSFGGAVKVSFAVVSGVRSSAFLVAIAVTPLTEVYTGSVLFANLLDVVLDDLDAEGDDGDEEGHTHAKN